MQKVAKSWKLESTLDVLCHLYQTQMLLVASEFAAQLLFLYFSVELIFIYKVVFILFKCIFKFTFMFQQTWKILLDKRSKTYVNDWKLFFLYYLFYIFNTWSVYWFLWINKHRAVHKIKIREMV